MDEVVHSKDLKDYHDGHNIPLPLEKLSFPHTEDEARNLAVLVETGSFNPPTYMHLNMFDSGREALVMHGYHVVGGYMSPVKSAYGKKALQPTYQRTLKVLARVADTLHDISANFGLIRVMLLCGADILESFTVPGIWFPDQVETICRDYGLVCIQRGERDLRKLIQECDLLSKHNENIIIVDNFESDINSTRVRENLALDLPVDSLTPASVIDYIKSNNLYGINL